MSSLHDDVDEPDEPEESELVAFVSKVRALTHEALIEAVSASIEDCEPLRTRIETMSLRHDPKAMQDAMAKRLTMLLRDRRFVHARGSHPALAPLRLWVDEVAFHLMKIDPSAALRLLERLIRADGSIFEQVDDSDGAVGDLIRAACEAWLRALAATNESQPHRAKRIHALYLQDDYGAREPLLGAANIALEPDGLRELAAEFEAQWHSGQAAATPGEEWRAAKPLSALSLLAEALKDPALAERAILLRSPNPNEFQAEALARTYLRFGDPAGALKWIAKLDAKRGTTSLDLLAQAHGALGHHDIALDARRDAFARSPSVAALKNWTDAAPLASHPQVRERAHQAARALDPSAAITAANLLLYLGDAPAAEAVIVAGRSALDGRNYVALLDIADRLELKGRTAGAITCYRVLMEAILDRAYAKAYPHAARYWHRLRELDGREPSSNSSDAARGVELHPAFVERIKAKHFRKIAFWTRVREHDLADTDD